MSGERPPAVLIKGCVQAVKTFPISVVITGEETLIQNELKKHKYPEERILILPSHDVIGMDDVPSKAFRQKKDASLMVGCRALKGEMIDAFITPGNTGAALAAALFVIGRIKGVKRPALAISIPTRKGYALMLDGGANSDCNARYLRQFALMGSVYYKNMHTLSAPSVGLLNVGEEDKKGSELAQQAYKELQKLPINFIGNIEPNQIFSHKADVIICDGFVGNLVLKNIEGTAKYLVDIIKSEIMQGVLTRVGAFLMSPVFRRLKQELNPARFGAAPLLGVSKPFFIGHGNSSDASIFGAIRTAVKVLDNDFISNITEDIDRWG